MTAEIAELEQAVQSGSKEKRVETLRRVTDLFLTTGDKLNETQIDVFDNVLGLLVQGIEKRALADLSGRIATVQNAPVETIRALAHDDEISVAGPILTHSPRLTAEDLIGIVNTKSQAHLLAVSARSEVEERVTSALVERGNHHVLLKLSSNPGARFTAESYSSLIDKANTNQSILEALGLRADLPLKFLKEILSRASDFLRTRLAAAASPELRASIRKILNEISAGIENAADLQQAAQLAISELNRRGELKETAILRFASRGERNEVVAALALLNSCPIDVVDQIFSSSKIEARLVPCKATSLGWLTVLTILRMIATSNALLSREDESDLRNAYELLTPEAAQRTLRFWQVRSKVTSEQSGARA
ncbi:MAG: DUF2336 domain-containing protein [Pseudorhodoplanes sp.]